MSTTDTDLSASPSRKKRIENALWGLFAGDALAMPAHWIYELKNLQATFDGGVQNYEAAPHPHPESFMVGMSYQPNTQRASELSRPFDILHEHSRFYQTSYSDLAIASDHREEAHGNSVPAKEDRYHYHHGLKAGENTIAAHLVRVLMRSIISLGRYDESHFLSSFIEFLTTKGNHKDPYTEIYLRRWFENYSEGVAPNNCAEQQAKVWSIGSHGGMIRPMVLSLLAETAYQGLGFGISHQVLTHRSENVTAALGISIPLLHDLLAGIDPLAASYEQSRRLRTPTLTGHDLHAMYSKHRGPGNIPKREMWKLHTHLSNASYDLEKLISENEIEDIVLKKLGTACYPEHGLPLLLFLAAKTNFDLEKSLLANANAGGDNVHRGAVLGLLVGAARETDTFPNHLIDGLADRDELAKEISAFAQLAVSGCPW